MDPSITAAWDLVNVVGWPIAVLFASYKGWWVWGATYLEVKRDRDEWKTMALRLGGITDRYTKIQISPDATTAQP